MRKKKLKKVSVKNFNSRRLIGSHVGSHLFWDSNQPMKKTIVTELFSLASFIDLSFFDTSNYFVQVIVILLLISPKHGILSWLATNCLFRCCWKPLPCLVPHRILCETLWGESHVDCRIFILLSYINT